MWCPRDVKPGITAPPFGAMKEASLRKKLAQLSRTEKNRKVELES